MSKKSVVLFHGNEFTLADLPSAKARLVRRNETLKRMTANGVPNVILGNQKRLVLEAELLVNMIIDKFTEKDKKAEIKLLKAILKGWR